MRSLSINHITRFDEIAPLSPKHSSPSPTAVVSPYGLLIRGDAAMRGAGYEPIDTDQAKALAKAIHEHLIEEDILTGRETVLLHNGLFQYFSLLDQGFRVLTHIHREVSKRVSPWHRYALATSAIGISSEVVDVIVHTTHRVLPADDPRAAYYVLPVYFMDSNDSAENFTYIPSQPCLKPRLAHILHADSSEIEILGLFSQESFQSNCGGPYEAAVADMIRASLYSHEHQIFLAGPVPIHVHHDVVSLPSVDEDRWVLANTAEGYNYSQFQQARASCAKAAHRAGARVQFYQSDGCFSDTDEQHAVFDEDMGTLETTTRHRLTTTS